MNTRLLYATIFVLTAIEFLQLIMIAFGAGPIMGEIGLAPEDFSLIAAVYASVAILVISMQRWLVTRFGGRLFIQCATAISLLGAVLCATSHDFASFLLGRFVMAIGGGALFTSARMIIHHRLAGPQRFAGIKALAYGVLGLVGVHVLAAVGESVHYGENLVAAMIHGRKRALEHDDAGDESLR